MSKHVKTFRGGTNQTFWAFYPPFGSGTIGLAGGSPPPFGSGYSIVPCAGTIRNFGAWLDAAPGAGTSYLFQVWHKAGAGAWAATALSFTIADLATSGSDITHSFHVDVGDCIAIMSDPTGSPPSRDVRYMLEFDSDNAGEHPFSYYSATNASNSATRYAALLPTYLNQFQTSPTATWALQTLVGIDGAITRLHVRLEGSPGGVASYTFAINKNGTLQNGSGGTTDTRVTITGAATEGSATFTLDITPGDLLYLECTPSGTPTARAAMWSTCWLSDVDGLSQFTVHQQGGTGTANNTLYKGNEHNVAWNTTEADVVEGTVLTDFTLTGLRVTLHTALGAGRTVTYTLRRNGTDVVGGPTVVITHPATSGASASGEADYTAGDTWTLKSVVTGGVGTSGETRVALGMSTVPPVVIEPDVETLGATEVRSTQGRIRGRIDPNDIVGVTGRLIWGTSAGSLVNTTDEFPITDGTVFISFSELLGELEPGTTYYFQAIANDGVDDFFGAILSFTTLGEQTFIDGTVSHPLTWITITRRDEERHPYAEVDLNDPPDYYDGYKAPYVEHFLTIARGLSDRDGQIEHLTFGAVFSDTHREFRALLDDEVNKYLTNRPLEEWFIDDEERRRLGLARLAAVGFVNDYSFPPNLQFEIKGADWLKKKFSRKRKAQQSWQPLITIEDFPTCPEETLNTPAPIIYGSLGLSGADPVENVQLTINAQPTAAPGGFAITTVAGGVRSGITRYYKVSQIVGGLESEQSATLSETTTNTNRTIRTSWTPDGSATAIYLYRSHRADFAQFALVILPGAATSYDDDSSFILDDDDSGDWLLGLRLNLTYYVYAKLAGGLFSRPGIATVSIMPIPVQGSSPDDRTGPLRERDIDITWDAHPDEVDGYRVLRHRSYYSNWDPLFDRQIEIATGAGETTNDDVVTTSAVTVPTDELIALAAAGQVKAIHVGELSAGSPGTLLNAFLIARHACSRVGNIYLPVTVEGIDGEDETTYEPVADSDYGTTWFAPDHAGWLYPEKYVDLNGRRYTLIFTTLSPLPDEVLVDVDGVEEDGNGDGDLIESLVLQRLHFVNNWIAPDTPYQSGAYLNAAATVFPHIPTLPLVDENSHFEVEAALQVRLPGGYVGATIIGAAGEFVTATDALARFHISGDFDQAFNRRGQDTISCEPVAPSDPDTLTPITDIISIRTDSFSIQDQVQTAFFNILPYVHSRDYTGRERTGWYGNDEIRSQTSIDNYDQERESPRFELHCCRANTTQGAATIADVMARKLARYQDPRRVGTLVLPFSGLNHEPGSTAAVTHVEGIGASGWELKEVRFTRHEVDPTAGTVRLDFYDLTKVFENQDE